MVDEPLFRVFLFAVTVLFAVIWLRAAFRAGITGKFVYNTLEGLPLFISIRVLVLISLVFLALSVGFPHTVAFSELPLAYGWRVAGLILAVVALLLFHWVFSALGRHFSTSLDIKESHQLISTGPYRYVRHPMYVAYVALWVAFTLVSGNLMVGVPGVSAFLLAMFSRIGKEEQMLLDTFGEQYREYMKDTGRFLPKNLTGYTRG